MRFLNKRRLLALIGIAALFTLALIGAVIFYLNSPAFEEQARKYIVREIERRTATTVSLKHFDVNIWRQHFRLDDLTVRGLEPASEKPLAHFDYIDIGLNFRTLFQRKIDLYGLTLIAPDFHVMISSDGKTNVPTPPERRDLGPFNFEIAIADFSLRNGSAVLNERRIAMDFSLANLEGILDYSSIREVLGMRLRYDGVLNRSAEGKLNIPYSLSGQMDYTRGTLLAHQVNITAGDTSVKLQGKVNDLFNRNIAGKFEYTGNLYGPFLNYFFPDEEFAGRSDVAGLLEFARGYFFTNGNAAADTFELDDWHATKLRGDYAYHYPEKRLSFRNMHTELVGGSVAGAVVVDELPGASRVNLDLTYAGIDGGALARAYPWDPKYRIFSRLNGTLDGWFEGKLKRFAFSGEVDLKPYARDGAGGVVVLPLDGHTHFELSPGQARVRNGNVNFLSTAVEADGLIDRKRSDLKLKVTSSDLRDLTFIYSAANGSGAFGGVLRGPVGAPELSGDFDLAGHKYGQWTIERAAGGVRLDIDAKTTNLHSVRITQGESRLVINGRTTLDGSSADLRIQSDHISSHDLRPFIDRNIEGVFSGDVRLTSFNPLKAEGTVHANNLVVDGHAIGAAQGRGRYFDPEVDLDEFAINRNGARISGSLTLNRSTDAIQFGVRMTSVDLNSFQDMGVPPSIGGTIRQADLQGSGTLSQPNLRGNAVVENLSLLGEQFERAVIQITSAGTRLDIALNASRDLSVSARIDTADKKYPFDAKASFNRYLIRNVGGVPEASLVLTGTANLNGFLTDRDRLQGEGTVESAEGVIQGQVLRTTRSFTFTFNPERLTVSGVVLTGQATQINFAGTIGLRDKAPLNLDVSGRVDLGLLSAAYPEYVPTGILSVEGRVGGNIQNPDLRGVARLSNASLARRGLFTTLTGVNGELFFDENRVTINNISGRVGGGTIRAQGTALLAQRSVEAMNVRIQTDQVRLRYPEGLRTVVNGSMVLRGSWTAPLLEGNLQIQSLSYRSSFEEFLALIGEPQLNRQESPFGRLALALHVEGSRNITIQNQLADVEARIDVDIKGGVDDPRLTGHIEASGGTLLFQGKRYRITRGNIDFINPLQIEPVVDVQAESEVRNYRVILAISGRGNRLRLDLRSDPPLPELEIVSLIAGGRTREEIRQEIASQPDGGVSPDRNVPSSEKLFQGGAASILFDLLQSRVGGRLGLFGLDRVRIDPFLVGAENNPVARITLSEQVTKDLSITYSQDLSSNRQQVILIEYFITTDTSVVASRDEFGNLGLDVRFRKRFK